MEKEKKGLFGRLLDFWREKIGMGTMDGIGFWNEKETGENHFAEMGAVAALSQKETKRAFWQEKGLLQEKEQKNSILEMEQKIFLKEDTENRSKQAESTEEVVREKRKPPAIFSAKVFQAERQEESIENSVRKVFIPTLPEEKTERRQIIPVAEKKVQEREFPVEEAREQQNAVVSEKEEKQTAPEVDIEKLMRQMTKKLWEEREGCGRRLR